MNPTTSSRTHRARDCDRCSFVDLGRWSEYSAGNRRRCDTYL